MQRSVQVGRQANSVIWQASVGPHCAHCVPYSVPDGQLISGVLQAFWVQPSCPSSHSQLLQLLLGSGIRVSPLGYTMPPTLQAVSPARSGALSQLPAAEQIAGPGATHGGQGLLHSEPACMLRAASSLRALALDAFTGVGQPHDGVPEISPEHCSACAVGSQALARFSASAYWSCRAMHLPWHARRVQTMPSAWQVQVLQSILKVWPGWYD